MSHSLVKYKFADNQDCFPACPPGSMEVSRLQPCQLSCSRRVRSSLTSGYWCALLSRASSDNSRTTNLESPLPTERSEAWKWSQSIALPRVLLGRFVEQLDSTLGNVVSYSGWIRTYMPFHIAPFRHNVPKLIYVINNSTLNIFEK